MPDTQRGLRLSFYLAFTVGLVSAIEIASGGKVTIALVFAVLLSFLAGYLARVTE